MNLLIVPFHDWRKILLEGFRTRDAHFIEEFNKNKNDVKVIINRPTTILEILLKRKRNLINGTIVHSSVNFKLYKLEDNVYLIDFISNDIFGQIVKGYSWFIEQYGNPKHIDFINESLSILKIKDNYHLLNQNVFAYNLSNKLNPLKSVFDAWDDFTKFNVYIGIRDKIVKAYRGYGKTCDFWITNSRDNITNFKRNFKPKNIFLISNGVDVYRFVEGNRNTTPKDIQCIPRPIVGFGGKITQLIDTDLLNETMKLTKDASFVLIGQMLDKQVYKKIQKLDNFFYLGDKHYDEYPNYVNFFDICIVPYVVDESKKSGANSIKVYEYLATNKKVVGTKGNGLLDLQEHLYLVDTAEEFSEELKNLENKKPPINIADHSWESKVSFLLNLLKR